MWHWHKDVIVPTANAFSFVFPFLWGAKTFFIMDAGSFYSPTFEPLLDISFSIMTPSYILFIYFILPSMISFLVGTCDSLSHIFSLSFLHFAASKRHPREAGTTLEGTYSWLLSNLKDICDRTGRRIFSVLESCYWK